MNWHGWVIQVIQHATHCVLLFCVLCDRAHVHWHGVTLQGGEFTATLLVGDASISPPVSWTFATLDVSHAADLPPLAPPFLATRTTPKPEIHHMFVRPLPLRLSNTPKHHARCAERARWPRFI